MEATTEPLPPKATHNRQPPYEPTSHFQDFGSPMTDSTTEPTPPIRSEVSDNEPVASKQGLSYSIEQPDRLWELVGKGTKSLDSVKSGGFVVCGPELGNLGGSPLLRVINNRLTIKIDLNKMGGGSFYQAIPTESLQAKMAEVMPDLEADGVNVYANVGSRRERIAYKNSDGDFVYEPTSVGVTNAAELQRHLELASKIYVAYATAYYEDNQLTVPQDILTFTPKALEIAEQITQTIRSPEGNGIKDMLLTKKPDARFEEVGGQDKAVKTCRRFAEQLKYADVFALQGSEPPRGILLWGPQGTGKTLLAKAIANEAEASFIHIQASDLAGEGLYGQTEKVVTEMFSEARKLAADTGKQVIIFVDEGDLLLPKKTGVGAAGRHEATGKTVGIFAQAMDGIASSRDITVIISTNEPGDLDPRILSRMDEVEEVPRPDANGIEQIFKIHFGKLLNKSSQAMLSESVDLAFLSKRAYDQGLSGRDVADVIGILARIRGQEQLKRMKLAIHSGRITVPDGISEVEVISGLAKRISTGDIAYIEDLVMGPITQDEVMRVIDESKSLLKSQKSKGIGFLSNMETQK